MQIENEVVEVEAVEMDVAEIEDVAGGAGHVDGIRPW